MMSQVEEGFLVSDGHLSSEEYNFSIENGGDQESALQDRKAEIELRRQKYKENLHRNSIEYQQ